MQHGFEYVDRTNDLVESSDIQETITGGSGLTPGTVPLSKLLFVDVNRTDAYIPDGTINFPFKTINAAVAQVITNGDGLTNPYVVNVAPGTYPENVVLENATLGFVSFRNWALTGYDQFKTVFLTGNGVSAIQSTANNANLFASFEGFYINLQTTITGSGVTPNFTFLHCIVQNLVATNGNINFFGCLTFASWNFTNTQGIWTVCDLRGVLSLNGTFFVVMRGGAIGGTVTVNSGAILSLNAGVHGIGGASYTVNNGGELDVWNSHLRGSTTVNAGGILDIDNGSVQNLTGSFTSSGSTYAVGNVTVTAAAPTVGANQVSFGSSTAATATAGAATLPANPVGFLIINVAGTARKIPFYAT